MKFQEELIAWMHRPYARRSRFAIRLTNSEIEKNALPGLHSRTVSHSWSKQLARTLLALLFFTLSSHYLMAAAGANPASLVRSFREQKVIPDDGVGDDGFGYAVAISGTTAMVSEAKATINGREGQGEVYVFTRMGAQWILTQKLIAGDGAADDVFGSSISLSGDTAIIGALGVQDDRGAAYVFKRSGDGWKQAQKLTASDGLPLDWFGYSVGLSGTHLIVGARNAQGDRGAAYFYDGSSGDWVLAAELTPADLQPQDYFGNSVAISGTTALVGAFDIDGHTAGAAYIFNYRSRSGWIQTQKLVPSDGERDDWFGWSVALSDNTAVIGANQALINNHHHQGAVYVFNKSSGVWIESQKLLATDGAEFGALGTSVALDGDTILAGAPGRPAAYLFNRTNNIWSQRAEFIASDYSESGGNFAWKAALDGYTSLVSSTFSTVNGNPEGAAYFFQSLQRQFP